MTGAGTNVCDVAAAAVTNIELPDDSVTSLRLIIAEFEGVSATVVSYPGE